MNQDDDIALCCLQAELCTRRSSRFLDRSALLPAATRQEQEGSRTEQATEISARFSFSIPPIRAAAVPSANGTASHRRLPFRVFTNSFSRPSPPIEAIRTQAHREPEGASGTAFSLSSNQAAIRIMASLIRSAAVPCRGRVDSRAFGKRPRRRISALHVGNGPAPAEQRFADARSGGLPR